MLGIPAADVPLLIAWIFFVDTAIILAIAALRWYKSWLPQTIAWCKRIAGMSEKERDYVNEIYQPMVLKGGNRLTDFPSGQAPPAE